MAGFPIRHNKNGTIAYRVVFRRKGRPTFATCFLCPDEAKAFAETNEKIYCLDPYAFVKEMKKLKLKRQWMREFNPKGTKDES